MFLLRLARIFQSIPPFFLIWLDFIFPKRKLNHFPIIFIVAPPRSGSTLTYQIVNRGTNSIYISNLWNLLYAIPYIGGRFVKKNYRNNIFSSDKGLVQGVNGESEGMRFWSFWIGQDLEEKENKVSVGRLKYIKSVFSTLINKRTPLISGYLGNIFVLDFLRNVFPGSVFIYLKRDELSNIYSMIKTYKEFEKNRNNFKWMSVKPKGWEEKIDEDVVEKVIWQYKSIKKKIESSISEKDTLIVNYDEICNNPHNFLKNLKQFVSQHNIDLDLKLESVPSTFISKNIEREKDNLSMLIYESLNE